MCASCTPKKVVVAFLPTDHQPTSHSVKSDQVKEEIFILNNVFIIFEINQSVFRARAVTIQLKKRKETKQLSSPPAMALLFLSSPSFHHFS